MHWVYIQVVLRVLLLVECDWIQVCDHLHCSGPTVPECTTVLKAQERAGALTLTVNQPVNQWFCFISPLLSCDNKVCAVVI